MYSTKVKQFTEESGHVCSNIPIVPSKQDVKFLAMMMISEIVEMLQVQHDDDEIYNIITEGINMDKSITEPSNEKVKQIADIADAITDTIYYSLNACSKWGINIDKVFNEVHNANMSKKWEDGKFHKREDGKIIKPANFKSPNIMKVILDQMKNGSW